MTYAITGGIGSGKSYVCRVLAGYGIKVYDCDAAAKRLMRSDRNLQQRISETVGKDVFPDGVMDKAAIADYLLASEENNQTINSIVHPAVLQDFRDSGMSWMESAILFECGFDKYVDKSVCVVAPEDIRLQRVMERDGISREKAQEWIDRQMSQETKASLSDFTIINDGTMPLKPQIEKIINNK